MLSVTTFILALLFSSILAAFLAWHARNILGKPSEKEVQLTNQLAETKNELDNYKRNINNHFEKTAHLFNDLSKHYKNLYEHLKTGSKELCSSENQVDILQYKHDSNHIGSLIPTADTDNILHNWHPTYFEAKNVDNFDTDSEHLTNLLDETSKHQHQHNDNVDLLADLDKLDDLDKLNHLNSLGNLDDLDNLDDFDDLDKNANKTNTNKFTFKDKIKIVTGKKKVQDPAVNPKEYIQTENLEKI